MATKREERKREGERGSEDDGLRFGAEREGKRKGLWNGGHELD